jgi:predicted ATPase
VQPECLYQLVVPGLPSEFPPLRTLGNRPTNLPIQPNLLIGRDRELEELRELLRGAPRLVTLTGPGGSGKTRLALQLGADVLDDFASGVFFVSLAAVQDSGLVVTTIAQALAVRETPGELLPRTLAHYLAEKELLLVLDNFEQVVEAAPALSELMAAAPGVKLVVTSRERLRLVGERVYEVAPLAVVDHTTDLAGLAASPAVALFAARARAVSPGFEVTAANGAAVAAVCARVDGLPLAIELAASRVALLPPETLLGRLDRRLKLLTGGARDLDERHRTLRRTIEWSYELLTDEEQRLFAAVSIFAGGFRLDGAEAVCAAALELDAFDGVQSLLEKSLVGRTVDADGEPRFSMLETIREFGLERLHASGDAEAVARAHVEHFVALAEATALRLTGSEQVMWLTVLDAERPNMRAALEWALADPAAGDRTMLAVRLTGALGRFWYVRAEAREGSMWLKRALAADPGIDPAARARALHQLGVLTDLRGDPAGAAVLFEESLAYRREVGDEPLIAAGLNSLSIVMRNLGQRERARELLEECLVVRRRVGEPQGISTTTCVLGVLAVDEGRLEEARALFEESLELDRTHGDRAGVAINLANLATVAIESGAPEEARTLLAGALEEFRGLGDPDGIAECLEGVTGVAAAEPAARLAGAAAALRDEIGSKLAPPDEARLERRLDALRTQLGAEGFDACFAAGRQLALDAAVEEAFEALR